MFGSIISLLRPHQWVKNIFVILPLFFGGHILDIWCWKQALITFAAFMLISSSIYCLNDIIDMEADRMHPLKRNRPLASGKLKPLHAAIIMCVLSISSFMMCSLLEAESLSVALLIFIYMSLNVAYCYVLKKYAIIDVFVVALGFVIRLLSGGLACEIPLSPWIILMTFLLALFLAFAKRRDDVILMERKHIIVRKNVSRYNIAFINQTLGIVGSVTIVCYIMYSVSPEVVARFNNRYVYLTSIFVLGAILRYLQVTVVELKSGSPTNILFRDRFIQVCLLLWFGTFMVILYV